MSMFNLPEQITLARPCARVLEAAEANEELGTGDLLLLLKAKFDADRLSARITNALGA